jgi:hypothetical protein
MVPIGKAISLLIHTLIAQGGGEETIGAHGGAIPLQRGGLISELVFAVMRIPSGGLVRQVGDGRPVKFDETSSSPGDIGNRKLSIQLHAGEASLSIHAG